jgi:hypothetical protein
MSVLDGIKPYISKRDLFQKIKQNIERDLDGTQLKNKQIMNSPLEFQKACKKLTFKEIWALTENISFPKYLNTNNSYNNLGKLIKAEDLGSYFNEKYYCNNIQTNYEHMDFIIQRTKEIQSHLLTTYLETYGEKLEKLSVRILTEYSIKINMDDEMHSVFYNLSSVEIGDLSEETSVIESRIQSVLLESLIAKVRPAAAGVDIKQKQVIKP